MIKNVLHVIGWAAVALTASATVGGCIRDNAYERNYTDEEYEAATAEEAAEEPRDPDKVYPEEMHFAGGTERIKLLNKAYYELQKCDSIRLAHGDADEVNAHMRDFIRYAEQYNELTAPESYEESSALTNTNFYYHYVLQALDEEYESSYADSHM